MAKVSVARRITRAFFVGLGIGTCGAIGNYLMANALNIMTGMTIVSPAGLAALTLGFILACAIGAELSSDIASDQQ